jgi:hypothetical protein
MAQRSRSTAELKTFLTVFFQATLFRVRSSVMSTSMAGADVGADGPGGNAGGAVYVNTGTPSFSNCVFISNTASAFCFVMSLSVDACRLT